MISLNNYHIIVRDILGYDLETNPAQLDGVNHEGNDILMLVAGPGSGKTAVLILRALRHVLVDGILPEHLLITTFTRKAAKELRTRWLDWGTLLLNSLQDDFNQREMIRRIDLNRCRIDTLDSIAQQALIDNRFPGEVAPILIDESASKLILKRIAFSRIYNANKRELDLFFSRYTFNGDLPHNQGEALSVAKALCDRLIQDRINLESFSRVNSTHQKFIDILTAYLNQLQQSSLYDYAVMELRLLERLQNRTLLEWTNNIRALLIDEYQDTNPLQEAIYFEIIRIASPLVTIVGDDDQAMYRFRGGSVELFTQFANRCFDKTGRQTRRINMVINYRSSKEIVNFYNSFITGDPEFAYARISPPKPEVISYRGTVGMPVLGLFRDNPINLANSLADFLEKLFTNRRIIFHDNDINYEINLSEGNNLGDCVLLAHTIEEVKYNRYNGNAETRFAGYLRNAMIARGMHIFNPRGRSLRTILSVKQLLGLLLLCIDPDGLYSNQALPTNEARFFLTEWRNAAINLIAQDPVPRASGGLRRFVEDWQSVSRGIPDDRFPSDWPVLELIFKLVTWLPGFQRDPEHQVWLEAIMRTVSSAGIASPYGMQLYNIDIHRDRSRVSLIRDALLSIAENESEVDENIMPSVPRNWLQLMTIHQAKGLEFPLVIVDVGCHFAMNHPSQAFLRFPNAPSNVVLMEDDMEPHLESPLRSHRSPIDRSFDDLTRLYYVAYSRPQSVLLLIGCESCLAYGRGRSLTGAIPNIALGWIRDGTWPWRQPFTGNRPPVRVNTPFLLINV